MWTACIVSDICGVVWKEYILELCNTCTVHCVKGYREVIFFTFFFHFFSLIYWYLLVQAKTVYAHRKQSVYAYMYLGKWNIFLWRYILAFINSFQRSQKMKMIYTFTCHHPLSLTKLMWRHYSSNPIPKLQNDAFICVRVIM
jgi:hypothetical protein